MEKPEERDAAYFIEKLGLQQHPEGGFFAETYRSEESLGQQQLPSRFGGSRSFSTAIYFLLPQGQFSAFHRIKSDELWHFYYGAPLNIYVIHADGALETICLGSDPDRGAVFQAVVKAGCWFASAPVAGSSYALVGCTVEPDFDFADFELANAAELGTEFPQHRKLLTALCRS